MRSLLRAVGHTSVTTHHLRPGGRTRTNSPRRQPMKRRGLLLGCGAVLAIAACDWNRPIVPNFPGTPLGTATLNASSVVPPTTSAAGGTDTFELGTGTTDTWVDYRVNLSNIQGLNGLELFR